MKPSQLGMVFQGFNLWSHRTILENVIEAPIHVQGRPRAQCIGRRKLFCRQSALPTSETTIPAICPVGSSNALP